MGRCGRCPQGDFHLGRWSSKGDLLRPLTLLIAHRGAREHWPNCHRPVMVPWVDTVRAWLDTGGLDAHCVPVVYIVLQCSRLRRCGCLPSLTKCLLDLFHLVNAIRMTLHLHFPVSQLRATVLSVVEHTGRGVELVLTCKIFSSTDFQSG